MTAVTSMGGTSAAESIQRRMAQIRRELDETVDEISDQARQLRDWRHYVRSYPWLFAAAALAAGYAIVPERRRVSQIDPQTLAALAGQGQRKAEARTGFAGSLARVALGHMGSLLARSAAAYVAQKLSLAEKRPFEERAGGIESQRP
jgi:hypothetical protein